MARLPRLVVPHQVHHLVQMGVDGRTIFVDAEDFQRFYAWLVLAAKQFDVDIHAYALLPNRLHLLLTPKDEVSLGKMMQLLGRYYVPYFNAKYQRSGTLWQGRFKATVIESEKYFLPCCVLIEELAIRLGLVQDASSYAWSSCQHHLGFKQDVLLTDHPMIWNLGNTPFQREAAYKALLEAGLSSSEGDKINDVTHKGWALGSDAFVQSLAKQTDRRAAPTSRGRPRKVAQETSAE